MRLLTMRTCSNKKGFVPHTETNYKTMHLILKEAARQGRERLPDSCIPVPAYSTRALESCTCAFLPQASEAQGDADLIASTTAHLMSQEQLKLQLAAIGRQMHAKQQRLVALQQAVGGDGLRKEYNAQLKSLAQERDTLVKEKSALVQVRSG